MHSSEENDFDLCIATLHQLIRPEDRNKYNFRRTFRAPDDYTDRIRLGVRDGSYTTFMSRFTSRIVSLPAGRLSGAIQLIWLLALQSSWTDHKTVADTEYLHALLHSQTLFNHLISIVWIPGHVEDSPNFKASQLLVQVMQLLSVSMEYIAEQEVQEIREDFIKVLIRADIFDAVEYALVQRANTDVEIYRKSLYPVFSYPLFGISHAK